MKTAFQKINHAAFLLVMLLFITPPPAFAFVVDGLEYTILNDGVSVSVSAKSTGFTQLDIPSTVEYSGQTYKVTRVGLCGGNRVLTDVVIPNTVTEIGDRAFNGCSKLTNISIPSSVVSIGIEAFNETKWYNDQPDGLVYAGCVAYKYKNYMYPGTSVVIKEGTVGIADFAFEKCQGLQNVTFPSTLYAIGNYSFSGCTLLENVSFPQGLAKIGDSAFGGCNNLKSVSIPESVSSIGGSAFSGTYLNSVVWNAISCDNTSKNNIFYTQSTSFSFIIGDRVERIPAYLCSGLNYLEAIEIPNSVKTIGERAFDRCYNLKDAKLPNSIMVIPEGAFNQCWSLTGIELPNTLTTIEQNAFAGCNNLTSIDIPNRVKTIGEKAFAYCSALTTVTIPDSVEEVGGYVFRDCTKLSTVYWNAKRCKVEKEIFGYSENPQHIKTFEFGDAVEVIPAKLMSTLKELTVLKIPVSLITIESGAFSKCTGLEKVIWNAKAYGLSWEGLSPSVLAKLESPFKDLSKIKSIEFGDEVEHITYNLCKDMNGLQEVSIGKSVKAIRDNAFAGCTGLTAVHISDMVAWFNIEFGDNPLTYAHNLFLNGEKVKKLVVPDGVEYIKAKAFDGCHSILSVSVPSSILEIGEYAFRECDNIFEFNIGDNGREPTAVIGKNAFAGSFGLTQVKIGGSVKEIGERCFYKCISLEDVDISPNVVIIGSEAFAETPWYGNQENGIVYAGNVAISYKGTMPENCELELKPGTNSIAKKCFSENENLKSIVIPNSVVEIGDSAFLNCTGLMAVEIPNSVQRIRTSAFNGCRGLYTLTFGNSLESIGDCAFEHCEHLSTLEFPNSLKSIGEGAFHDCKEYGWWGDDGCYGLYSVKFGDSLESIGDGAFHNCALTSVELPSSLTNIGINVFAYNYISDVILPSTITQIPEGMFYSNNLVSVDFLSNVTRIGRLALGRNPWLDEQPDGVVYAGKCAYTYIGNMPERTPVNIKQGTVSITEQCFKGLSNLITIGIPKSLNYIAKEVFDGCSNLTSVRITDIDAWCNITFENYGSNPLSKGATLFLNGEEAVDIELSNTSTIEDYAFYGYGRLKSIVIPETVKKIGRLAFYSCNGLESLVIPNTITTIDNSQFSYCSSLASLSIGNSVTSIGNSAFYNCSSLASLSIGNSVTSIGTSAFYNCSSLESLVIPNSVDTIGASAFYNCSSMASLTIGNSVTTILRSAFYGNNAMAYVTSLAETPPLEASAFSNYSATLYVPAGSVGAYKADNGWNSFARIEPISVRGDVTGSGFVDVDDLSLVIDMVLGKEDSNAAADLNGDGIVDVTDLSALIDIMLGN